MLFIHKTQDLVNKLGLIPHPEGGFFLETYRSGCQPMTTNGQTNASVDPDCLVARPQESDKLRHALTSIYWLPTLSSPNLVLCTNRSPHVHYYQGGRPFEYILYNPADQSFHTVTLGPDLDAGHSLQVCVPGGWWKAGKLVDHPKLTEYEYALIGEGVGPGFDFVDLHMMEESDLAIAAADIQDKCRPFLHHNVHKATEELSKDSKFVDYYAETELQQKRVEERIGSQN
jgi:uncharacterized protein